MKERLRLYRLDTKYAQNLAQKDSHVMSKENRPHLGIVVPIKGRKYCIPLTSIEGKEKFKNQKTKIDCICVRDLSQKNENGAFPTISILNVNNMVPVDESVITPIDIKICKDDSKETINDKILQTKELDWCQKNSEMITSHATRLYNIVVNHPQKNYNLVKRCCKFDVLEGVLEKWIQKEQQKSGADKAAHNGTLSKSNRQKGSNPHTPPKKRLPLDERRKNLHKNSKETQRQAQQQHKYLHKRKHNSNDDIE